MHLECQLSIDMHSRSQSGCNAGQETHRKHTGITAFLALHMCEPRLKVKLHLLTLSILDMFNFLGKRVPGFDRYPTPTCMGSMKLAVKPQAVTTGFP